MPALKILTRFTRCKWVFPLVVAMALLRSDAWGQDASEYEVKAVYIYNFVNFVEWPAASFSDDSAPFVIGVVGTNVFGNTLSELVAGEQYRGRRIEVRPISNASDAGDCQIVFIERTSGMFDNVLSAVRDKPVLTIAHTSDFMERGGMIRFYLEDKKIKIEINQKSAAEKGLVISSKLLRLAKIYER